MVEFNGTLYSYVHNLQGDIVGIVDSSGSLVVEYKYDAWGKPTLVRTLTTAYEALAELNPFRYRGYVYDEETGLYYLRSRYYSTNCGRFINVDSYSGKLGQSYAHNLSAYSYNSPIAFIDKDGYSATVAETIGRIFFDVSIYAPSPYAASKLAAALIPGSTEKSLIASMEEHSSSGIPGDYYWHWHTTDHKYHIWYGVPLQV